MGEMKLLKKCLGDSDGFVENNIEVYDWDYGATMFYTEQYDTWVMSGTPHAIKLVKRVYIDINTDSSYNMTETAVTAYFEQFSSTLYMLRRVVRDGPLGHRAVPPEGRPHLHHRRQLGHVGAAHDEGGLDALFRRLGRRRLVVGLRRHDGPLHHHQDLEGGGDVEDVVVRGQVPHHR